MSSVLLVLVAIVVMVPVLVWGTTLETFSLARLLMYFGPMALGVLLLLSRRRPTWFLLTCIVAALPVLGLTVPPARLGLSVFSVLSMVLLALVMQARRDERPRGMLPKDLKVYWVAILLMIPSVLGAIDHQKAAIEWLMLWGYYATILVGSVYFLDQRNIDRTHVLLALSLAAIAISVLVQKILGVRFDWLYQERGAVAAAGSFVRQGSGFFQDPQKAAQSIAMLTVYLLVIWQRRSLPSGLPRILVVGAILLAIPALLLTLSRLAIAIGLFLCVVGFLMVGRKANPIRVIIPILVVGAVGLALVVAGWDQFVSLLPAELQKRFMTVDESAALRYGIWESTFKIFLSHPLFGVGMGNYRDYLMQGVSPSSFVPDQPESGYLKVLYEVGAVGFLGIAWAFWRSVRRLVGNLRSSNDDVRSRAWASAGALTVFCSTFSTLFTTSDARNAIVPVLILAITTADYWRHVPSRGRGTFGAMQTFRAASVRTRPVPRAHGLQEG